MHACEKILEDIENDPEIKSTIEEIKKNILGS
jgi:chromosomal replication initiation ATPase DnaA